MPLQAREGSTLKQLSPRRYKKPVVRPSTLKLQAWEQNLPADYKDREFILSGIKNGFHVLDMGKISQSAEVENYSSATNLNMRARTEAQILT